MPNDPVKEVQDFLQMDAEDGVFDGNEDDAPVGEDDVFDKKAGDISAAQEEPYFDEDMENEDLEGGEEEEDVDEAGADDQDSGINQDLINAAKAAGLTDDEINAFGNEAALQAALRLRSSQQQEQQDQSGQKEQTAGELDELLKQLDLEPDDFEGVPEQVAKAFKAARQVIAQQNQQLQTVLSYIQQQEAVRRQERFDQLLNQLDGAEEIFGSGPTSSLSPTSQQFAQRAKVAEMMASIEAGRQQAGLPPMSFDELFKAAVNAVAGDKLSFRKRTNFTSTLRPGSTNARRRPMNARERAVAFVRQKLAQNGGAF